MHTIIVPGNRPHVPVRSHTGCTLQCPAGQPFAWLGLDGWFQSKPCKAACKGRGCGRPWAGRARCHNELATSIGPSGPPEYAPPVRQRAVRRSRRAGGARGTIWSHGGANADQTLIRKTSAGIRRRDPPCRRGQTRLPSASEAGDKLPWRAVARSVRNHLPEVRMAFETGA